MSYDLGTAHGTIELEYNGGAAAAKANHDINDLGDEADKADRQVKKLDRSLNGLGGVLSVVGKGAGFTLLGAGIAQAAVSAANLGVQLLATVAELAPLLSLSAAIPGALAGAAGAAIVLKAAMLGVGDAFKAAFEGDSAKFQESLKRLAPEAQKVAIAFQEAVKPIKEVQQALQNTVFQGLAPTFSAAVNSLLPLKDILGTVANEFNRTAQTALQFAAAPATFDFLQASISQVGGVIFDLNNVLGGLLAGFRDAGTVGLQAFGGLGTTIASVAERFGAWMSQISASGQLAGWIDQAKTVLSQLLNIIGNIGTVFGAAVGAASSAGSGFLGILNQATTQLAAFAKSAEGSAAIQNIFNAIAQVANQLAPVLTTLVGIIGGQLGPVLANVALAVGPALLAVVQALGPGIAALTPGLNALATALGAGIAALAPALGPLGAALGAIVSAIAPILPMVGQLAAVLVSALAPIIIALAPAVSALAQGLSDAFVPVLPIITQLGGLLAQVLGPAVQLLSAVFAQSLPHMLEFATVIIGALMPVIQALIPAFQQIVNAVLPLIPAFLPLTPIFGQLIVALTPLLVAVAQLAGALITLLAPLLQAAAAFVGFLILNGIAPLLSAIVSGIGALAGALTTVVGWITQFVNLLGSVDFGAIGDAINNGITAAFVFLGQIAGQAIDAVVNFFIALPGRIGAALAALPGLLVSLLTGALNAAAFAVGFGIGVVYRFFTEAPGKIGNFLSSLPGILSNLFNNALNAAKNAVTSGFNAVVSFVASIPGRVGSALSALGGIVSNLFSSAMSNARNAVTSGVAGIISGFQRIPSAISGLAGELFSAGANMIHGAINGVLSAVGGLVDAARNAAKRAVDGFKSALGISSPSRVFADLGVFTIKGFIVGVDDMRRDLDRAMKDLVNTNVIASITPNLAGVNSLAAPFLSQGGVVTPTATAAPSITIEQHIEPVPTMDAQQYADYTARKILSALYSGVSSSAVPPPTPTPAGA